MTGTAPDSITNDPLRCCFCGKSTHEVRQLVAGPAGASICDECVDVCVEIIAEKRALEGPPAPGPPPVVWPAGIHCCLCRMPVSLDDAIPVEDRGSLCRPCVTRIQLALSRRVER